MKTIYLAGPMNHVTPEQAMGWRKQATEVLKPFGYEILDPTVGKDMYDPDVNTKTYTPDYIVNTDLRLVEKADILLVDISHFVPMVGTSMEIKHASERNKTIITWGETNKESYWIRKHVTKSYNTLEEALFFLKHCASIQFKGEKENV